jgi:hypothetical protein
LHSLLSEDNPNPQFNSLLKGSRMSNFNIFKVITLFCLVLSLASCGKSTSSSKKASEKNPVCAGIDCLSSIDWTIYLNGQDFPDRARIDVNGVTVLDECLGKQHYKISRFAKPQYLKLEDFRIPKRGEVRIHIVDQGYDCGIEKTVVFKENVSFEIVKNNLGSEIVINL